MKVLKTKAFARIARSEDVTDGMLLEVVGRAVRGLIDADLGGGLIKQRVARRGEGRSGGFRTLVAYRAGDRIVFVHMFAKRDRDNIRPDVAAFWRQRAGTLLGLEEAAIRRLVELGDMMEVPYDA